MGFEERDTLKLLLSRARERTSPTLLRVSNLSVHRDGVSDSFNAKLAPAGAIKPRIYGVCVNQSVGDDISPDDQSVLEENSIKAWRFVGRRVS